MGAAAGMFYAPSHRCLDDSHESTKITLHCGKGKFITGKTSIHKEHHASDKTSTYKEATFTRYHYSCHTELRRHLHVFLILIFCVYRNRV